MDVIATDNFVYLQCNLLTKLFDINIVCLAQGFSTFF